MAEDIPRIGPYELVRRLGRGGMAETYLARRRGPGGFVQDCCLKRVLPQFADDAVFRDQFLDEATLHGRLQHGNIVRVSDFGEHDGTYFLVMELVDGCDLADLLEAAGPGQGLPPELAITVAADLCQALAYAHALEDEAGSLELVHRDLTPSNVLLTRAGEVKLSDFGIARAAQRRHRTQTGYTKGKFCYMSPEQIEAAPDLDGRSDLFALGCVLYEMLAGVRPFEAPGGNDLAVLPRILEGTFEPLRERAPHLPEELCRLVHALLSRDRDERPVDAQGVLEALAPLLPPVTVRSQLATRVRAVCEAREVKARAALPAQTVTAAVDLEAETRPAFVGEPTAPMPASHRSGTPAAPTNPPAGARPSKHAMASLLASLAVAALVALGFALRPDPPGASAAKSGAASAKVDTGVADPAREPPLAPPATAELSAPSAEAPRAPEAELHASEGGVVDLPVVESPPATQDADAPTPELTDLRVVVVPYGTIWIDGARRGRTRVRAKLPAGRHRIGIGRGDTPTRTEDVVLAPGHRTLEYALDGSFE